MRRWLRKWPWPYVAYARVCARRFQFSLLAFRRSWLTASRCARRRLRSSRCSSSIRPSTARPWSSTAHASPSWPRATRSSETAACLEEREAGGGERERESGIEEEREGRQEQGLARRAVEEGKGG
eukprot:6207935-Pleurochrysis_carterae.AAC.1